MPTNLVPPPHAVPTPVEQNHFQEALGASQIAIDSVGAITSIASYTLTILGVFIALLALWGVAMIVKAARDAAKQIANSRFNDYIQTDEFKGLVEDRIAKSIKERWQNTVVVSMLQEEKPEANDPSPFPKKPNEGAI